MSRKLRYSLVSVALTAVVLTVPLLMAAGMLGQVTGENDVPLSDKAVTDAGFTAPYLLPQRWGDGVSTGVIYNATTGAATTTYADAAIRFAQDAVTGDWFAPIPDILPSGGFWGIIRDGADGAEAKTDTEIGRVYFEWDTSTNSLRIAKTDMFVSF